jgi:hypothetical protein
VVLLASCLRLCSTEAWSPFLSPSCIWRHLPVQPSELWVSLGEGLNCWLSFFIICRLAHSVLCHSNKMSQMRGGIKSRKYSLTVPPSRKFQIKASVGQGLFGLSTSNMGPWTLHPLVGGTLSSQAEEEEREALTALSTAASIHSQAPHR